MKAFIQMAKLSCKTKSPMLESAFLRLYSKWHETHNHTLEKRMFMSLNRLIHSDPGYDFRKRLWQAL